eukprot:SM000008S22368  [mRNA]  locus=s8:1261328:1264950:- [translate_table: standard]
MARGPAPPLASLLLPLLLAAAAVQFQPAEADADVMWFLGASTKDLSPTIKVGEKVTWTWSDTKPHAVQDKSGKVTYTGSGSAPNFVTQMGFKFSHTFTTAGSFSYNCFIHQDAMAGTITVQASPPPLAGKVPPPAVKKTPPPAVKKSPPPAVKKSPPPANNNGYGYPPPPEDDDERYPPPSHKKGHHSTGPASLRALHDEGMMACKCT